MKIQKQPTLADSICDLRARKIKKTFFTQIDSLNKLGMVWNPKEDEWEKKYLSFRKKRFLLWTRSLDKRAKRTIE